MAVRVLSIRDIAPEQRRPAFGRYELVIEADGKLHDFLYTFEMRPGGGRAVQWEPTRSFLSDPTVPVMVVGAISDTVERYHRGETVKLPLVVLPQEPAPGAVVIQL